MMEKVDTLVMDKPGTLTEGKPRLVSIEALAGHEESDVLRLAASWTAGSKASVCGSRATAALDCAPGSRRRSTHVGATLRGALCYTPPSL
jgi:cation transport ATPase